MTTPVLQRPAAPPRRSIAAGALHLLERNLIIYRRNWLILVSGFFEPVFYLFAIGVGVGTLIEQVALPDGTLVDYAAFVAPAMLAASAMNGAVYEGAINFFFKLRYGKVYDAILSTPIRPAEIAMGELGWSLIRGGIYAAGFLVVMVAFGLMRSPLGFLALPAAVFIGVAFGGVGMAAASFMRSWQDLDLITAATLPIFLFSGTFFPPPGPLRWALQVSPLYHGTELIRALTLGRPDVTLFWHISFLVGIGALGLVLAGRRVGRLLTK